MVVRNDIAGFVLVGPKPSGMNLRPDEMELIGWSAQQIGLDLQTLGIEQLEAEHVQLAQTSAELERVLYVLRVQPAESRISMGTE
jgi:hypothetical protein